MAPEANDQNSNKILYWIMTGLLGLSITIGSVLARDIYGRLESYSNTADQRHESLLATNALRGERMMAVETKLGHIEPRINAVESKLGVLEPRLPLLEIKLAQADTRLQRIEEKLDRLLLGKGGSK